jgi:hypothetical protein
MVGLLAAPNPLDLDVKQRLSLSLRLDLYDVIHIGVDSGWRRFVRLVDDQLNSSLRHCCRHWVNLHRTPTCCITAPPNCQTRVYAS